MSPASSDSFTFSFTIWMIFFFLSKCFDRTSSAMVNESGYPCLVPHLRKKAFTFSLLTMMIAVAVSYRVFSCVKACFFCTHFLRIFIINGCWILLNAFPAPIEVVAWFLSFILIMWCIKLIDCRHWNIFAFLE